MKIVIRTASGTFHDGDLLLNQKGLRLISEEKESRVALLPNIPIYLHFSLMLFCRICYLHYHIPSISDEIQFWLCFPLLASALCVYSVFLMLVCDGVRVLERIGYEIQKQSKDEEDFGIHGDFSFRF